MTMGQLIYGVAPAVEIDDRALRHVEAVIISKLRRNESFSFHWDGEPDVGEDVTRSDSGRHGSVWVSKSSSLYFSYDSPGGQPLNRAWIDLLLRSALSPAGLRVLPEPKA
ncbi:DUF7882 family protein [Rathayibacter sp. Leaf248]|nr:hypothetical protein [Rathayibacter sp. Leaf248]